MSGSIGRSYLIQQWNDASSYSGEMIGQRLKQSTDLYLANGKANIGLFEDKPKVLQAKKKSAFETIMLADRNYERLCGLSEQLDQELDSGKITDFDAYCAARKNIDKRLAAGWSRVCKERNWSSEESLDTPSDSGLHFNLDDIQKAPKQPSKQRNTGWATIDTLSPDNCFRGLFWRFKQVMMMASKGIIATKQIIATIKQAHKQEN